VTTINAIGEIEDIYNAIALHFNNLWSPIKQEKIFKRWKMLEK
jgi:hypothetical protein